MISRLEAQELVNNIIEPLGTISLAIEDTLGYVLANDIYSKISLPPFNKSAMDGYAINSQHFHEVMEVTGEIKAGDKTGVVLKEDTCVRIMTGAPVPMNADKVVMQEHVEVLSGNRIRVSKLRSNNNICLMGEDIEKGQLVYKKGTLITPLILANIISIGVSTVDVFKKPKIGLIITGDELLEAGEDYKDGKIYNSNGPLLKSLILEKGISDITVVRAPDDSNLMNKCVKDVVNSNDVTIITGGISVGDYDFTKSSLEALQAKEIFYKLSMKPGKPLAFYEHKGKYIFALPGNPVSVFVQYNLFVVPSVQKLQGLSGKRVFINKKLDFDLKRKNADREQFVPIAIDDNGDAASIDYHGSAHLVALAKSNAFAIIPKDVKEIKAGNEVEVYLIK